MRRTVAIAGLCLAAWTAYGQPDLSQKRLLHGTMVCPDMKQTSTFYYLPNDLGIKQSPDGKPDLRFVMMRYTGTAVAGDQGRVRFRNILQFDVAMKTQSKDSLALVKKELQRSPNRISLIPLPMSRIEAGVHYTPVGDTTSTRLGKGALEAGSEGGLSTAGAYWQERTFSLTLDNETAQVFDAALKKGMLVLSVGYGFYCKGKVDPSPEFSGTGRFPSRFRKLMEEIVPKEDTTATVLTEGLVHANAFEITIDTSDYHRYVNQVDLNESLPPGYSILSIYNYDFNNALRPDLYEKLVEVEAVGAGGGNVHAAAEFRFDQPELYSRLVRFAYAVRLDKPYRYRLREILVTGEERFSPWTTVTEWAPILDVTTRPHE